MVIAIAGHTGFVGTILKRYFVNRGYDLVLISRNDLLNVDFLVEKVSSCDVVINLCGASIVKRWTKSYKKVLLESRIFPTVSLLSALQKVKCNIHFINASAIGIYNYDEVHTEESQNFANDYLGFVVKEWERSVIVNVPANVQFSLLRLALVLDSSGGYLKNILTSFKFKFGIYFKNASNNLSFIDSSDLCRLFDFVISQKVYGIVNCVSPNTTTNIGFAKVLRKITKCWFLFALPDIFLKLTFGESFYTLKQTPKVYPKRLLELGFVFKYGSIEESLKSKLA
jgi:uncharacterized protein